MEWWTHQSYLWIYTQTFSNRKFFFKQKVFIEILISGSYRRATTPLEILLCRTIQFCKGWAVVQVQCWHANTLGRLKMPMQTFWYWLSIDYYIVTEMPCSTKKRKMSKWCDISTLNQERQEVENTRLLWHTVPIYRYWHGRVL